MSETRERVHIEEGPKRVRTYVGGELIADTKRLKLVWEVPYYPAYYFPREDVRMELLTPNGHTQRSPSRGDAHNFTVKGGDREVEDAAWHYPESPVEELRDLIRFDWDAMDGWFEEDEEVFVHPRRGRGERREDRRHAPADAAVRDELADSLLHPNSCLLTAALSLIAFSTSLVHRQVTKPLQLAP